MSLFKDFIETLRSNDDRLNELNRMCNACHKFKCKHYEDKYFTSCKYKYGAMYLTYLTMKKKMPKQLLIDCGYDSVTLKKVKK